MSALARVLLQRIQSTTDLIDRMERRGLVSRTRHPTDRPDRRIVLIAVTDTGTDLLAASGASAWAALECALSSVPADDLIRMAQQVRDHATVLAGIPAAHLDYATDRLLLDGEAFTSD